MSPRTSQMPTHYYYFAYGSNMRLRQMVERCPLSLLIGKGRIEGYRWQINERGVANIVESSGRDFVEGIVYQIGTDDRKRLDRSEGVARGFYEAEWLFVGLTPLPISGLKTFHAARELEEGEEYSATGDYGDMDRPCGSWRSDKVPFESRHGERPAFDQRPLSERSGSRHHPAQDLRMVEALVYVSGKFKSDGPIRHEYIGRMEKAVSDARTMGLSNWFLNYVDHVVHLPPQPEEPPALNRPPDADRTTQPPPYPIQHLDRELPDNRHIEQPSRDYYGEVNVIERVPRYGPQVNRTIYHVYSRQQEDDPQYYVPSSRGSSRTNSWRSGDLPTSRENSSKMGRSWFGPPIRYEIRTTRPRRGSLRRRRSA